RSGAEELHRSFSRRLFWKALRRLVPELSYHDLGPGGAGVRAQAGTPPGDLVDDFRIVPAQPMIHLLHAPSPAAPPALSIGRTIAAQARETFDLPAGAERMPA